MGDLTKDERDLIIDTGRHVYGCCSDDCEYHGLPEDALIRAVAQIVAEREKRATREALLAAADIVQAEHDAEVARLTTAEHPEPHRVPMLSNWLGGIQAGATALRDRANQIEAQHSEGDHG